MSERADTISSTKWGRNLTPQCIVESIHKVLGNIDLDPCSDAVANEFIKAREFYTKEEDGFTIGWKAKTLFMNPPGKTSSMGKEVKAAQWVDKLWSHWRRGDIGEAIYLCYRGGSIGGVPFEMLSSTGTTICLTCKGSKAALDKQNKAITGSGRICFETVDPDNNRVIADKNTQSSMIVLLSSDSDTINKFWKEFEQYGAIF